MTEPYHVYIAIDTEFEGPSVTAHNLLQIGLVAFKLHTRENLTYETRENLNAFAEKVADNTPDIEIVEHASFCFLPQEGKTCDPQCMAFWANFPDVYAHIKSEMRPIDEQFAAIQAWLAEIYKTYCVVAYVADIAAADFPWLKSLYAQYCVATTAVPMPYRCISTHDIRDTLADIGMLSKTAHREMLAKCPYPHTHYAVEDAMQTAYEYGALVQCKANVVSKLAVMGSFYT
jgi:hypothetical protein